MGDTDWLGRWRPRKARRPNPRTAPTPASIRRRAGRIEGNLEVAAVEVKPVKDWRTSVFGALALLVAVAGLLLKQVGYEPDMALVALIAGMINASGLLPAADAGKSKTAVVVVPTPAGPAPPDADDADPYGKYHSRGPTP